MKRKVLRVGNASLAVSLPSKWVKAHGIGAGDELEVEEGESLTISRRAHKARHKEISLTIDQHTYYALSRMLTELYRDGYARITLIATKERIPHQKNEKEENLQQTITKLVQRFLGAEIVSQTKRSTEIEFFVPEEQQDLDKIEKRVYYLFKEAFTEMVAAMAQDYGAFHATAYDRHDNITKFVNFYLRILRASGRTDDEKLTANALYVYLDKAADILRHISDAIHRHGHTPRLRKELEEIFALFCEEFTVLFKLEDDAANIAERYRLRRRIERAAYTPKELAVLAETMPLLDFINLFSELAIVRKLAAGRT